MLHHISRSNEKNLIDPALSTTRRASSFLCIFPSHTTSWPWDKSRRPCLTVQVVQVLSLPLSLRYCGQNMALKSSQSGLDSSLPRLSYVTLGKCQFLWDVESLPIENGGKIFILHSSCVIEHIEYPVGAQYMLNISSCTPALHAAAAESAGLTWTQRDCTAGPRWNS